MTRWHAEDEACPLSMRQTHRRRRKKIAMFVAGPNSWKNRRQAGHERNTRGGLAAARRRRQAVQTHDPSTIEAGMDLHSISKAHQPRTHKPRTHKPRTHKPRSYTLHPTLCTLHPTPCTLHPTPCTLHPAPCTLHPAPYTAHPAPCTRHPSLRSLVLSVPLPPLHRAGSHVSIRGGSVEWSKFLPPFLLAGCTARCTAVRTHPVPRPPRKYFCPKLGI